ncbi:hypothetical protein BGZ75_002018, partial [Mortierella antarctica]
KQQRDAPLQAHPWGKGPSDRQQGLFPLSKDRTHGLQLPHFPQPAATSTLSPVQQPRDLCPSTAGFPCPVGKRQQQL